MSPVEPIVAARDIRVQRGGRVQLEVPELCVGQGEILSLIGPNGAGKTTLLQVLSCLIRPSSGSLAFQGTAIGSTCSILEYRRKLSMVFQEPLLFDTTVFNNVASGLKMRGLGRVEVGRTVEDYLERFGIGHLRDRSARTLSGGEAQRTSLARSFAIQPKILFLDEPFSSLDPPSRESLIEDLELILRETKTTTLLATHDRTDALRLSDRIAVMRDGRILQTGSPREITHQPVNEFVASFVGTETILKGKVIGNGSGVSVVSVQDREIAVAGELRSGEEVVLCIRPENVVLSNHAPLEVLSARNVFQGIVERVVPMGLFQRVHLDCGFPLIAYVTNPALEQLSVRPGVKIAASLKATAIHVIRKTGRDPETGGKGRREAQQSFRTE